MSDAVILGIFGFTGVIITTAPALIIALSNRSRLIEAKDNAVIAAVKSQELATTIGAVDGNGDLMNMMSRILEWQATHVADDLEQLKLIRLRMSAIENLLDARTPKFELLLHEYEELSTYIHTRNHDIFNALTGIRGKIDMLWDDSRFKETPND